jgi:hypothetical protein
MNSSSAQDSFSITLNDTITIDTSSWSSYNAGGAVGSSTDTITITGGGAGSSYTIGSGAGIIAQDIGSISGTSFTWKTPEEFVDAFPDYDRVQQMCEEYPGLKLAYEKFVTTYKLVRDHYDTPEDQRPKP